MELITQQCIFKQTVSYIYRYSFNKINYPPGTDNAHIIEWQIYEYQSVRHNMLQYITFPKQEASRSQKYWDDTC